MKYVVMALGAVALAGCSILGGGTPQTVVYATGGGLAAAEQVGTVYATLPICGGSTVLCSDPSTVAAIKAADVTAHAAYKSAETVVRMVGSTPAQQQAAQASFQSAFNALTALTSKVKVK